MNEDIKPWEQLIIGTFSKSSLEGVQGGVDSGSPASSSQCHTLLERETSYPFGCQLEAVETTQAAETTQAVGTCEETREEFETVIFENSLPSADGAASYPSIQNKKKRKSPYSVSGNEGDRSKPHMFMKTCHVVIRKLEHGTRGEQNMKYTRQISGGPERNSRENRSRNVFTSQTLFVVQF
uniref:Uncharacterized protein LOC111116310 n=1 Tax=Crassostrea virginica TaxID=6565 RepID=A0A8B8C7B4_CRAVI|nr:uncharacterized protein LOC111116310 [Crassostrea virginica]